MKIGIYKIESPSGKIYIGQSKNIDARWERYRFISNSRSQQYLNNSFAKYGIQNHIFEIVEECSLEELSSREIYWISFYNSYGKGLNLTTGGESPPVHNKPMSQEQKNKISLSNKGRIMSPESRKKISESIKGRVLTKEHIKGISDGRNIPCSLTNKLTGEIWNAESFKELVKICPLCTAMISKLKKKESKQYKLQWKKKNKK